MTPLRVDTPQAGFYWRRFVRGGPKVAVKLWHGAPLDPVTGEELDRSHRWQAMVDGKHITEETAVLEAWISCAGNPITEAEYKTILAKAGDAAYAEPSAPEANPHNRVDRRALRPITPPRR
jgi:hypothetical protein